MKRIALLTVLVLCLPGCVLWKDARMTSEGDFQTLTFSANSAGLLPGICEPGWGKFSEERGSIYLSGDKETYTESDFFIVRQYTKPVNFCENVKGTIKADRKEHVVIINASIDGKPYELNGRHAYKR